MRRGFTIAIGILLFAGGIAGFLFPARTLSREHAMWNRVRSEAQARGENPDAIPKPDRLYDTPVYQYFAAAALLLGGIGCLFWKQKHETMAEASEPPPGN